MYFILYILFIFFNDFLIAVLTFFSVLTISLTPVTFCLLYPTLQSLLGLCRSFYFSLFQFNARCSVSFQVVSYSYRTEPDNSKSQRVIYGSGSADKPVSKPLVSRHAHTQKSHTQDHIQTQSSRTQTHTQIHRAEPNTRPPRPSKSAHRSNTTPIKPSKTDPYIISSAPSRDLSKGIRDPISAHQSPLAPVDIRKQAALNQLPLQVSQSAVSFVSTSADNPSTPQVSVSNPSPFGHVHESFAVHHGVGPEQAHPQPVEDFVIKESTFQVRQRVE